MVRRVIHGRPLSVLALGLGLGVVSGLFTLYLGIMAWQVGIGLIILEIMADLFKGFEPSFLGLIIGALWGFVYGFLFGVLVAWFYNKFLHVNHGCFYRYYR